MSEIGNANVSNEVRNKNIVLVVWAIISFFVSTVIFILIFINKMGISNYLTSESFTGSTEVKIIEITSMSIFLAAIISFLCSFLAAIIGNVLRKIAKPQYIISSGMTDILSAKLFWSVGPQFMGVIITQILIWYFFVFRQFGIFG